MRSSLHFSHLLLVVLLSTFAHVQSDRQLATNSPEEFSLGSADHTSAHEIILPEDYASSETLLLGSSGGDDETQCSQASNSFRHRMRVRGNDPSLSICPFNPSNQYNFKQPVEAPGGGQQQLDNSEAGQQFQLDGTNSNNKPPPETKNQQGEWWQRIIPDWLDWRRLLPSHLPPNKKTEELYNKGLCLDGNGLPLVTVCASPDPPLVAPRQVVIEWCRISTCASSKRLFLRNMFLVLHRI